MKVKHISLLTMFLISGPLAFANGNLAESKIPTCDYTTLTINVPSTVKLVARGESSGSVKGVNKELDALKYSCSNGKFEISTKAKVAIKDGYMFELANGSLSKLTLNGAQKVEITELAAKNFHLAVNGAGKSSLLGQVEHLSVSLSGAAQVDASALESQTGKVKVNGSGLVRLNVSSELNAKVNGSGRIEYIGEPKSLEAKVNGVGSISLMQ
ncbi:GIN domain-containing protein [Vibrio vulnificus]|uniref:GIN domain-containing protein n=1 Tax=Vibrio vulnificus TaxID=672 RepID=UPI0032425324